MFCREGSDWTPSRVTNYTMIVRFCVLFARLVKSAFKDDLSARSDLIRCTGAMYAPNMIV